MMSRLRILLGASIAFWSLAAGPAFAGEREVRTLEWASQTVREFAGLKLQGIPQGLLRDARGVAIIPGVVKAGFLIDGRIGQGVVLARQADGTWSNPVFVTLGGLGIGWQAGVESTDVVLIFRSARSVDRFLRGKGKLTLGGDASVAIGPVGREFEAATDARLRAEIFSYSRSRGLFAGVSVEGAALRVNPRANEAFYGPPGVAPTQREAAAVENLRGWLNALAPPARIAVPAPLAPPLQTNPLAPPPPPPGPPAPPPAPVPVVPSPVPPGR
jgi:lipid-binding SYLF domain-containing protein